MTLELTTDEQDAAKEALQSLYRYYRNSLDRCEIAKRHGSMNAVVFVQNEKACTRRMTAALSLAEKIGVDLEP